MTQILGWLGMLLREGAIELRHRLLKLCCGLNDLVDRLDTFACVWKAVMKHRGLS
jgi:hypothetical protein